MDKVEVQGNLGICLGAMVAVDAILTRFMRHNLYSSDIHIHRHWPVELLTWIKFGRLTDRHDI
jgi:hypothetical protein